jgi:hypothetical protein
MVAAYCNRSDVADVQCGLCGIVYTVIYNREDMLNWLSGQNFIQDAMPYLSPDERELLISRTCGDCFNKLFPPDLDIDE